MLGMLFIAHGLSAHTHLPHPSVLVFFAITQNYILIEN